MPEDKKNNIQTPKSLDLSRWTNTSALGLTETDYFPQASEFGKSKFDDPNIGNLNLENGAFEDIRGQKQPVSDKLANAVPRLLSKVGTEIVKTPGYLYALGEAGLTDKSLAESLDNAWLNGAKHFDDKVKEQFAIYKPKAVREGNLWDNFTSASFWTDEGVDGMGFLLGMVFPGAALKATGLATKLAKVPGLAKIGQANIELGQATLLNTALESAAETKGIVDNLKIDFDTKIGKEINPETGKLWTDAEAKQAIGDAAVSTFKMNMGLLLVPNMIMNKNILGRFNTSKTVLDEFKDASGKFVLNSPIAKKSAVREYLKGIGEATVAEGFIEEAGQTTIENYNSKLALNKTNAGMLEGLATEYINTLTTTEGQKSILLGAVLGAMGGAYGKSRELKQEAKDRSVLSGLIKDNFEGFSVEMNNIFTKDAQGKVVIDPVTKTPKLNYEEASKVIANIVKEQQSTNLQDRAAFENDKDIYDYIYSQQLARFALPYLKQEGGLEILEQHIEDTSKILGDKSKKFSNEVDFSENEFKAETKKTLKDLQKNYNSIYSTITELGLDRLSKNPKHVEAFANKLAYTAYSETSKQIFIANKIKELRNELISLSTGTTADLPQVQLERQKLENRIENLGKSLEKSKAEYQSIFDPKEQEKAFANFAGIATKVEEVIKKAEKKEEKTPTPEPVVTPEGETKVADIIPETSKQNIKDEELNKEKGKIAFFMSEALRATNLNEFNIFKKDLDKSSFVTPEEKKQLEEHEARLKEAEGIIDTIPNTSQDLVSTYLNTNTPTSTITANDQVTVNPKEILEGKFKDLVKGISKKASVVMMHLFNHTFTDGIFRFKRDKNGLPELDNNSNLIIDALNNIKVGDVINFKLVELNDEAKKLFDKSQKDSIENIKENIKAGNSYQYSTDNNYGFDNKHIGIYDVNENLIGFVQQPHAISELIDGDLVDTYKASRDSIIRQRKFILDNLAKGEEVTSTITEKGSGNLYTKLTPDGKIDPINKVLDTLRDQDKLDGNAIFVFNDGEKLDLPLLESSQYTDDVKARLADLGNWGKEGSVYQLVKDTNNEWYPIPVYASLIEDKTVKAIIDKITLMPENIDPIVVVRALNPYIYTSTTKNVNIVVKRELDVTRLYINGEAFTISSIVNSRKNDFVKQLKTKRQNIAVTNINSTETQLDLKNRNTLVTNVTTFNGEYTVQPYIEYADVTGTDVEDKKSEVIDTAQPITTTNTIEETLKKRGISEDDINREDAFSRTIFFDPFSTNKVDKKKITDWLDKNLPGLSLYNAKAIGELKTNIKDAVGMYRDMVIYLFDYSSNKTAYHEAFHGVFRNMMSYDERMDLLNEVSKFKALEPTQANLDFIQQAYTKKYSTEQLTFMYWEEILADMFADYTDNFEEKSLSQKIKDFFNKILEFFGLYTKNNINKLDELFYNINTGKYKSTSLKAKQAIVNRPIKAFKTDNYVFSRMPGFSATFKANRIKSIGDNFIAQYWSKVNSGVNPKDIKPSDIYNSIFSQYHELLQRAGEDSSISTDTIIDGTKIIRSNKELIAEANKYIGTFGITIKEEGIEYKEQEVTTESVDEEITSLDSKTTKGFGQELVSIPGLKSASTRLKMFLSGIPVAEKGIIKKDKFGFPIYHDFLSTYYFLERNLTDLNSFDEMIVEMDNLAKIRPEVAIIKTKLLDGDGTMNPDQLQLLQNDFKSNFSKQQLVYTLVKFDTDSATGEVTFKIMDANRQTLSREIFEAWVSNVVNPARNTIAEHNDDGTITQFGTKAAKNLLSRWQVIIKKSLPYEVANDMLLEAGIEFSPEVLKKLVNDKVFIMNVTTVLDWYASDKSAEKEVAGRKALANLVNYEVTNMLANYTQSFNNVENKAIYTIQLPSFASKLLSKLTNKNGNKFNQAYNELIKEDSYKYSNLLMELRKDLKFRQKGFKLSYLDGLKDDKGNSDGAKFTNMSPKDFMYMQLALFDNNATTKGDQITTPTSKYVYITPADKTMSMIFDAKKYGVNIKDNEVELNSEILGKFYNVVLQEASRIKQSLIVKNSDISGDELLENYHYRKDTPPVRNEDGTWDIKWNGQAFKFNYFSSHFNKAFYGIVEQIINENIEQDVEISLESIKPTILNELLTELNNEVNATIKEAKDKQIISTNQKLAEFGLNTWLFNIEASKLLNGDPAIYKDLAKRTYQSGSMTVSSNTTLHPKVRTIVVKDHIVDSIFTDDPEYKGMNATDAQVYITPTFYKDWHVMRGTWTPEMQLAYDIAEGNIKPTKEQLKASRGKLVAIKPFYFGNRFDEKLGIQRYEQVKTAMLPLFKSYIKDNPLLAEKRQEMENLSVDMLAHESAFKAAIGHRNLIDSDDFVTLDLDMNNFGTQVDNPNHILDEANDSLRQLKMLLLGNIDPTKEYNGISGEILQFEINQIEGINIREDLKKLQVLMNNSSDTTFKDFIVEQLTKRGATENLQQILEIVNGEFKFPPDLGPSSTAFENLISSIFTDKVIKQSFKGGSAVQASALGLQFKNLKGQQVAIDKSTELTKMQTSLKWVRPGEGDKVEYAEAYMPAWAEEYFDKNGNPKDNIPDELREILIYRIPTEGYHSMLPVKVIGFMPAELGNFIMLPYEITKQFGADFDFDKIYFIAPEFYRDDQGNLFKTKYDDSKSPEENSREARNNRIFDNYMKVLSSKSTYPLLIKPSGFEELIRLKEKIIGKGAKTVNFYSSRTQRDLKSRNHIGLGLKGQSALHVSGHSYATMLGLNTLKYNSDGTISNDNIFRFNGTETFDLNNLYNAKGDLIADELSSMMAAILDDIKDPILEPLGINQYTIDVWATIVRSGYGTETAINLITQPAIRQLSEQLQENAYQIKAVNQGWNSVKSLLNVYHNILDEIKNNLSDAALLELKSEFDKLDAKNLNDNAMEFWRNWYNKNEDKLHLTNDEEHNKMVAKYYIYQSRVLNNFGRYDQIAKDLVKINRFFGINKEVGPNVENIVDKKYLLKEIQAAEFSIKGMENINNIDGLAAQYEVQLSALEWFGKYFPYDTLQYKRIKTRVSQLQYGKVDILSIPAETRQLMNGFIRATMDMDFSSFHSLNNTKTREYLFTDLPKKLFEIKDPRNDKKYFNGKLRENIFIKQLKVRLDKLDRNIGYISLNGNRIDLQLKDNISEAIYQLWSNSDTKGLMTDIIKHSVAATGLYTGLNSFHSYITPDIWVELGYDEYRKQNIHNLNTKMLLDSQQSDNLIDQLIRNFPKKFTKVFDKDMFIEKDGILYTEEKLVKEAKRDRDMIIGDKFVEYIRVYDKSVKRALIYKQTDIPGAYKYVPSLGKLGRMIEIDITKYIDKSISKDNNILYKAGSKEEAQQYGPINDRGAEVEYADYEEITNEEIEKPILESGQLALPPAEDLESFLQNTPQKRLSDFENNDVFGNVLPPSKDDIDNLPNDITPC